MNKTSTLDKLRVKKHEVELTLHHLHSMHDTEFVNIMKKHPKALSLRDTVVSISVREDNIKSYMNTGVHNLTSKDLFILIKGGDRHRIIEVLHSLDDNSLLESLNHPIVKEIADSSIAISTRLEAIESNPPTKVQQKLILKPVRFNFDY